MNSSWETYFAASNTSTPVAVLRTLAKHPCPAIRARVAENNATPGGVLEGLSRDADSDVRSAVTWNVAVPRPVLWVLALDPSPDVRYCIAENPYTAIQILIWLSADDNPYVALRAEKTIEAVTHDGAQWTGGHIMSAKNVERILRRFLHTKERLNKSDATKLRELILADGYVSRCERRVMVQAIENDLLDDDAFQIFVEVLLHKYSGEKNRAIA